MSYIFIGGIPASGKSYLAKKVSEQTGAFHLNLDTLRKGMRLIQAGLALNFIEVSQSF